jgi:integrating conjugative element protein (TIGR03749 family)
MKQWMILLISISSQTASATERLLWDKHPLQLSLPIGKERLVSFPHGVRVGIPGSIADQLNTQSLNGTVYWTASDGFSSTRVQIQSTDGSQLYLIDLSASQDAETSDVQILLPTTPSTTYPATTSATSAAPRSKRQHPTNSSLDYIILTRFAAQQLYAPARVLTIPHQVQRSRVQQISIQHLLRGFKVDATPIAAWRKGRLFVTAVRLQNQTQQPITLHPLQLRGRWYAATFQHGVLKAHGNTDDTTAVYLISDQPFKQAL